MRNYAFKILAITVVAIMGLSMIAYTPVLAAPQTIDISGSDNAGILSASRFKNWGSAAAALAGLPDYAYFEPEPGLWTSIVSEPLSAASTYAEESSFTVSNKTVTDADFATRSSGLIDYDDATLTGTGTEFIPAASLTITANEAGFSPLNSSHNFGSGSGNAGWDYVITIDGLAGTGLTFTDGVLSSIDLTADVSVLPRFFNDITMTFFPFADSYDGTLTISEDQFAFDVDVTQDVGTPFGTFEDTRLVFNRSGSISGVAIPEPASIALIGIVGTMMLNRRRSFNQ